MIGGVVPIAHNAVAMLTGYIAATQRIIACANQDVAYGLHPANTECPECTAAYESEAA